MEKVLYAEIDIFCGNGKECFCSNAHFAKMLQVSERRVQQILTAMENKGVITRTVVYKEGTKEVERRYLKPAYFTTPHEENFVDTNTVFTNPLAAREQPPQETVKVVCLYENNIHPLTSLIERDNLLSLCDDYPFKWIESAIEEAALKNGRSLAYIIKILERWGRDGFKVDGRCKKKEVQPSQPAVGRYGPDNRPPHIPPNWVWNNGGWEEPYED
jgi:DnaD/phage-associated family protein